ncbi:MAG TPA: PHP domain-containing protein, partial [Methylibium sp.]|nr:PHP domain-containing protein [Methylibium sp.]
MPPPAPPPPGHAPELPAYAELHCRSNFSFLRAASHPHELVQRAAQLGYAAIAITDECSVAGAVRAHEACKALRSTGQAPQLLIGAEFTLEATANAPGARLVLIAMNREGYAQLGGLITLGRGRSAKGAYRL